MKAVLCFLFFFSSLGYAADWDVLLDRAVQKGTPISTPEGVFLRISHIHPDPSLPHQADYFSAVGAFADGRFHVSWVSMTSETWRLDQEGNWIVDQWIHHVTFDGQLFRVFRIFLKESPEGRVLEQKFLPTNGPKDPLELERWRSKLEDWYRYLKNPNEKEEERKFGG